MGIKNIAIQLGLEKSAKRKNITPKAHKKLMSGIKKHKKEYLQNKENVLNELEPFYRFLLEKYKLKENHILMIKRKGGENKT